MSLIFAFFLKAAKVFSLLGHFTPRHYSPRLIKHTGILARHRHMQPLPCRPLYCTRLLLIFDDAARIPCVRSKDYDGHYDGTGTAKFAYFSTLKHLLP